METEDIRKKETYNKEKARLKKRIPEFSKKIFKIDKNYKESDVRILIIDMLCVLFGFNRESDINELILHTESVFYAGICLEQEKVCLVECMLPKSSPIDTNLKQTINYAVMNNYGCIIRTNCLEWEIYRSKCENHKEFDLVYVFKFHELDLKNEADLAPLYYICKEAHEPDTDIYNRQKWHGFLSVDKKTIDYMFLVHSIYYKDGSAKFHVFHLNMTYRCDEGSTARINAQNAMADFLHKEYGKIYDNEHKFVTVAYHKETEQFKSNCPVWW